MEILSLDDIQKLEAKILREILKSNSKCLPVISYPWIFRTQMICTQAQVFVPTLISSYPTLWSIHTQQIMTQNVENNHKHLFYLS